METIDEDMPIAEPEGDERPRWHLIYGPWLVSGILHATLILLAGTIYFLTQEAEQEIPPVRITSIPPPPPKREEKPKLERELLDPKVVLDIESKSDVVAPITQLDLPDETSQREEENDSPIPKGREEAVADSEMGGQGAFMAIGAGGGGAGMFGSRSGGGRKRAVGRGGGSQGSESAVEAALRWFKKHQSANGSWQHKTYFQNCSEDPKCEPGGAKDAHWGEDDSIDAAMTGYAVLCFLGAGYDHKTPNRYRQVVQKGLDNLVALQTADGTIVNGSRINYHHPIATMALAEAYAMSNDPRLRGPAQQAVDQIIARQNRDGQGADAAYAGLGWDYVKPTARNDASVAGWNVMALKSAYAGGLSVGGSMDGAKVYLERAWKASNPGWEKLDPYKGVSKFPYVWTTGAKDVELGNGAGGSHDLACVGMVLSVFLGHRAGDPMLETLGNWVMQDQTPKAWPTNTYFMYYNTLGIFQLGGERWKTWNGSVRDLLVQAQRKGQGCFDGSWDWEGTKFAGHQYGRVLSTAYCTLSLEVYYRYAQVQAAGKGGKH